MRKKQLTSAELDEMFDPFPRGPWKVTQIDEQKNSAYVWTEREYPKGICVAEVHGQYLGQLETLGALISAAPEMVEALKYAAELIPIARQYFPKSIQKSDRFRLENTCAAINKAIFNATGKL